MLETPQASWWYSSAFPAGSDNPQATRTISREVLCPTANQPPDMTPQRLHADAFVNVSSRVVQAYLQGALHDGTRSHSHRTHRFAQKGIEWLSRLHDLFVLIGHRSWIYKEGQDRDVFILETSARFLDTSFDPDHLSDAAEQIGYVRGYFDAEGGTPRSPAARFYIQLTQKNRVELGKVKAILESFGVACGAMHNPSVRIDPDYWRFFVRTRSHRAFALLIGSWHPRKEMTLQRMMI
jgi:LAGLIDADG-like domain